MYRKRELGWSIFLLIAVVAAIMGYCLYFANHLLIAEMTLMLLAVLSIFVLTDMLLAWALIFGVAIATVVLNAGVVYIPMHQLVLLFVTFPLVLALAKFVNTQRRLYLSIIKDDRKSAREVYDSYWQALQDGREKSFQAMMVHWAHNEHFLHVYPKEYRRMLVRMYVVLTKSVQDAGAVFYLSKGNFLILSPQEGETLQEIYRDKTLLRLLALRFNNVRSIQKVQFKSGYLKIDLKNSEKFQHFDEVTKNLERQLETDIIVEY